MYKGFKIRIYPTKEQEILFKKHIGCCRFIYNYMLDLQNKNYENGNKYISRFKMIKTLTILKKQESYAWLNEVSNKTLQRTCDDVDCAFKRFFAKVSNYPKFKKKSYIKQSFPLRIDYTYFTENNTVAVEKCGKIKYVTDFKFNVGFNKCKFINPRIHNKNGKWLLTFSLEYENQVQELNDFSMGIDLGIKELAVVSCNNEELVFHNINKSKKMRDIEKRIRELQRSMSRKFRTNGKQYSNNYEKERLKLRKLYARQTGIRDNYLHQTTRKLVNMKPKRVVMENLAVMDMFKDKHLAKQIQEQKFHEFIRQMKYKCEDAGIEFIQVDRFYPSSKTCSCCGNIKKDLKLSDRTYKCECCGLEIDRDLNAARNLEKYIA